ncbi:MAG: hypothetical protein II821_02575 [Treponema sp.]|nr:hypothetical protein [Treponema sp.]
MKKNLLKEILWRACFTIVLTATVLFVVSPVSCRLTEEGIEIILSDTTSPEVESFSVSGANSILLDCSEKIVLDKISVFEITEGCEEDEIPVIFDEEAAFALADCVTYSEDGKSCEILLSSSTTVGKSYIFTGIVCDISGNSLEFAQKFYGYNDNPAKLIFNEIRTTYKKEKEAVEFIEFYCLSSGNTYGLEFVSAANTESKKYSFPAIEVKQGEYITLHGRILEGLEETALDECGSDLALSTAADSCDTARDLWKSGTDKIVSNTDVVILRDSVSKKIKDAVLLSVSGKTEWTKALMKEFAAEAYESGIWKDGVLPENAVCTDGMSSSVLRSISRKNTAGLIEKYADSSEISEFISSSASDWFVTNSSKDEETKATVSGATPGYKNSTVALNSE